MNQRTPSQLAPPTSKQWLSPAWVGRWLSDLCLSWFATRPFFLLRKGLFFILLLIALGILPLIAIPSPETTYEAALREAKEAGDTAGAQIAMRRLIQADSDSDAHRFRLAEHYLDTEQYPAALKLLNQLAPVSKTTPGYPLAHATFVELSLAKNKAVPISNQRKLFHLRRLWDKNPKSVRLNRLMAATYLDMNQLTLAEPHLARVSGHNAELMLRFAQLETQLGKDKNASRASKLAEEMAIRDLNENADSVAARLVWARALMLQGREGEAERGLTEHYERHPEATRAAMVSFYTELAKQRYRQSPLFREEAVSILGRAFKLDPGNVEAANLLADLFGKGASVPADLQKKLAHHWNKRCDENPSDIATLIVASKVFEACGLPDQAIEKAQTAAGLDYRLLEAHARLLIDNGRASEADVVLDKLRSRLGEDSTPDSTLQLARVESLAGQHETAIKLLSNIPQPSGAVKRELVRAMVGSVDSSNLSATEKLSRLQQAMNVEPREPRLLSRICSIAQEGPEARQIARKMLFASVSKGELSASRVYAALGTAASVSERYEDAAADLKEAKKIATAADSRQDPITLNNLAIALARTSPPHHARALVEIDEALELLPGQVDLVITRGEVLVAAGRWADAVKALTPTLRFRPKSALVHELLSEAYGQLGNEELSRQHQAAAVGK